MLKTRKMEMGIAFLFLGLFYVSPIIFLVVFCALATVFLGTLYAIMKCTPSWSGTPSSSK